MHHKIKNFFFVIFLLIFISLITQFYFSEKNIIKTNKAISFYSFKINNNMENLPILKNDTRDIIDYNYEEKVRKKKKKYRKFWELIKDN